MALILNGTDGLSDVDGTAATPAIRGTDTNTGIFFPAADTIAFAEGGTEVARFDSAGNLGIGTSSPAFTLDVGGALANIRVAPSTATNNALTRYVNTGGTGFVGLDNSAGGLTTAYALNLYHTGAYPIVMSTSGAERMRITSGGSVKMTTTGNYRTSTGSLYEMNINNSNEIILELTNEASSAPFGQRTRFSAASPNNTTQYFYQAVDSTTSCFTIWSNGTTSGRSDERLKKNIVNSSPKLDDLCKLQVRNYEWKESNGGSKEIGLIAQEVEHVFPNLVVTHNIETQGDDYKEVKYSVFVPILIKSIQELKSIVDQQATELNSVKSVVDAQAARIAALENPPVESVTNE